MAHPGKAHPEKEERVSRRSLARGQGRQWAAAIGTAWLLPACLFMSSLLTGTAEAAVGPGGTEWNFVTIPSPTLAVPPLPSPAVFPVQLVLDDDSAEGSFGVLGGQGARQFLWFNRFTPPGGFSLEEIWVLFPADPNLTIGAAIQIAVYEDDDGDPSNGAVLRTSFNSTVLAADGNIFSIYPLLTPELFTGGGDVLIGVVPRFIVSGVTPPTAPAAIDTTASQQRSWLGIWIGDPPDPPELTPAPDQFIGLVDDFLPGNWMIRGFGRPLESVAIPTLSVKGILILGLILALLGWLRVRRLSRQA